MRPIACSVMLACCELAAANPNGAQVAAGSAGFATSGKTLTVTNTPGTIINWNAFSIGAGEATRFVQQSAASAVLNRVGPGRDASSILGTLWSNGRVFLVNPNGIVFGRGSTIDTAGFIASTLNITDQDFLSGRLRFAGGGDGVLRNSGTIRASGDIFLVGPAIQNEGLIRSDNGAVLLAAGRALTISSPDAHGITFTVQSPSDTAINIGTIEAANAAGMFAGTLRHSGDITVTSAHLDSAGRIVIAAQKDATIDGAATVRANGIDGGRITVQSGGTTSVSGTIEAKGSSARGGEVHLLGHQVGLFGNALVDVSGATAGGAVLVGGDYQGLNAAIPNALETFVGRDARIKADAITSGNGGKVILWSDNTTKFFGDISARGGARSGDGGFVEVSGKHNLTYRGRVDTRAPLGKTGTLLLDPDDITIADGNGDGDGDASQTSFAGSPSGTVGTVQAADTTPSTIFQSELEGISATTNISLAANNSISIADLTNNTLNLQQSAGNSVTLTAPTIGMAGTNDTIVTQGGSLTINASTAANLSNLNTNGGAIVLNIGNAGTVLGTIAGSGTALTKSGGGNLTVTGSNTYTGGTSINAGTVIAGNPNALGATSGTVNIANSANLTLDSVPLAAYPIILNGGIALTGSGTSSTAGNITLAADSTIAATQAADSLTISGVVSGSAGLTKAGGGTLTLSGSNTYTGLTQIVSGTLVAANANALGTTAAGTTVSNGANLTINNVAIGLEAITLNGGNALTGVGGLASTGGAVSLAADSTITTAGTDSLSLTGVVSGSGGFTKEGTGVLALNRSNTYTGATTVNGGFLQALNNNALGATSAGTSVQGSATLQLGSGISLAENVTLEAGASLIASSGSAAVAGNIVLNGAANILAGTGNTFTLSGAISGTGGFAMGAPGLAGVVALSGTNTYTGTTTINRGTLSLTGGAAIADNAPISIANFAGATLSLASNETIGSLAGGGSTGGTVALNANTLTTGGDNTSTAFGGVISGTGNLTKQGTGTFTLSGNNSYSGATTVSAGTLVAASNNALGTTGTGTLVASGANLTISGAAIGAEQVELNGGSALSGIGTASLAGTVLLNADSTITTPGAGDVLVLSGSIQEISGTFGITKAGPGLLRLSGTNAYSGGTVVSAGTLVAAIAGALGTTAGGTTIANGANLTIDNVAIGSEPLTLNGGNALSGIGSASHTGNIVLNATSTFTASAGDALSLATGTISGAVGAGVTVDGGGTITLSGTNTYTGPTTIGNAVLGVADTTSLGNAGNTILFNGAGATLRADATFSTSRAVTLTTNGTVDTNGNPLTLSGAIGGAGGLNKNGSSTLTLSGTNSYSGATTINGGVLAVNSSAALGDGTATNGLIFAGGSLRADGTIASPATRSVALNSTAVINNNGNAVTIGGAVSGPGGITSTGAGSLTLAGANTYDGATAITGGTVVAANANALGSTLGGTSVAAGTQLTITNVAVGAESVTLNGGILAGVGAASLQGGITLTADSTLDVAGADSLTLNGAIGGAFGVTKIGGGTLTLAGTNTYDGTTSINAGTLLATSSGALGSTTGGTTVASGAALTFQGGITIADALNVSGSGVGGNGAVRSISGNNTLTNTITLAGASTLQSDAGTLTLSAASSVTGGNDLTIQGAGNTVVSGTITTGAGSLTKNGTGTLTLAGANTYTGATAINAGTLVAANDNALGATAGATTVASGANLTIADSVGIGVEPLTLNGGTALTGLGTSQFSGPVTLATADSAITAASSFVLSGNISGAAGLTKVGSGALALSGTNTYAGSTAITAGVLVATGGSAIPDASAVSLASGTQFSITASETIGSLADAGPGGGQVFTNIGNALTTGGNNASTTFLGVISGSGGIVKQGTGTFTLSGANTYSGGTTLATGTLRAQTSASALGTGTATLNGGTLQLAADAATAFNNNTVVGGGATIASDRVTSGAGVTHTLGTLSIGTSTTLTVNRGTNATSGIGGVTFGATTLTGSGTLTPAANVELTLGAVSGAGQALTVNGAGAIVFSGPIGSAVGPLASVDVTAGKATLRDVFTTNAQTYNAPVTLTAAATLTSTSNGNIVFGGTLDGAQALTTDTGGVTRFQGGVGGIAPLASLTTNAGGSTAISNGVTIRTSGAQTYNNGVSGTNVTLTTTGAGGDITSTNAANDFAGTLGLGTASGNVTVFDSNSLQLGAVSIGGNLTLTGFGGITTAGGAHTANTINVSGNALIRATDATSDVAISNDILRNNTTAGTIELQAANNVLFSNAATLTANGAGGATSVILNANRDASGTGAIHFSSGSAITSNGGDITLGGGTNPLITAAIGNATFSNGVQITGGQLQAGGGAISILGTGSNVGADNNRGVVLESGTIVRATGAGGITIKGTGGGTGSGNGNHGVAITDQAQIVSAQTSAGGGAIAITGFGGNGTNGNDGVLVGSAGNASQIVSSNGAISITGSRGALSGSNNRGVAVFGASIIGDNAAGIAISSAAGPAGNAADNNKGVAIDGGTIRTTGSGNVSIAGTGVGAGTGNSGVLLNNAVSEATGTGSVAVSGTGSTGTSGNHGVEIRAAANGQTRIGAGAGSIAITGTGGGGGTGVFALAASGSSNAIGGAAFTGDALLHSTGGTGMSLDANISTASAGGTRNVTLRAQGGGTVSQSAPGLISAAGLRLLSDAATTFTLNRPTNDVGVLAGAVTGSVDYRDANGFTIGTLSTAAAGAPASSSGLTATGNIALTSTNAAGAVAINNTVSSGGTINVALAGALTVKAAATGTSLTAATGQTIAAGSISVDGTGAASVSIDNTTSGTQSITVGAGGLTIDAGANGAVIRQMATSGAQSITVNGGNVVLTGGSAAAAGALISGAGPSQTITINNADRLSLYAGTGDASITATGNQTVLLQGTGANLLELGRATSVANSRVDANGNQSVTAGNAGQQGGITILGGVTNNTSAGIRKLGATGSQTVVTAGTLSATGGSASSGTDGADAGVRQEGNGLQTVTANAIVLVGGSGAGSGNNAAINTQIGTGGNVSQLGEQRVTAGAGGISITGGSAGSANIAHISQRSTTQPQLITLNNGGSLTMMGGTTSGSGAEALILSRGPAQTLTLNGGGAIELTGGTNGKLNVAHILGSGAATSTQTISANGISLTGGANGGGVDANNNAQGNYAEILTDFGSQSITVGAGGLALSGGTGPLTNNFVHILQGGAQNSLIAGTSQVLTVTNGGSIVLTGGSTAQQNVVGGPANPNNFQRGSFANIQSNGDTQRFDFTGGGAIALTGGTVGSGNTTQLQLRFGANQIITGAPSITLTGGASGGAQNGSNNEGNRARIVASVGSQNIAAGPIVMTGGASGVNNLAQISAAGVGGSQTITAPSIEITGGAGGGGFNANETLGNFAQIRASGNQDITVGAGGITMKGGGGTATDNFANIFQGDTAANARQNITVNAGGKIELEGGSSAAASSGLDGSGSFAFIRADGGAGQNIAFGAVGSTLSIKGGTVGTGNSAGLRSKFGQQTITGSPITTLLGGASGGASGDNNGATIEADAGAQTLTLGTTQITGGPGGVANSANIRAQNQAITIDGSLTLNGTTGGTGATGARIGSVQDQPTNLGLTVHGDVTLNGGAVAGSGTILGITGNSTVVQTANITLSADGNVTVNGGTAGAARIGQPADLLGGGDIQITAGGNIVLGGNPTTGGQIRTAGNVTLQAIGAGKSITEAGATSLIQANTLTASAHSGIALNGSNQVATLNATNAGANGIQFTQAPGLSLGVSGMSQTAGDVVLTADDLNIIGAIAAGSNAVKLQPTTLARAVNIEPTPAAGTLSLTRDELAFVTAGTLEIGRADGTGALALKLFSGGGLENSHIHAATLRLLGSSIDMNAPIGALAPLTANVELRAANDVNVGTTPAVGSILLADNRNLSIVADADSSGAGRALVGGANGLTLRVGTGAGNTSGTMSISGRDVIVSAAQNFVNLEVLGPGQQIFSAADSLVLGNGSNQILNVNSQGTQSLTAGGNMTLAAADAATSVSASGAQTVNVGGILGVSGGTAANAFAALNTSAGQTIAARGISLAAGGGANVTNASATVRSTASQNIVVGAAGIAIAGGSGTGSAGLNFADLSQTGTAAGLSQTVTVNNGGSIALTGGSSAAAAAASAATMIASGGGGQTIQFTSGGNLAITGGSVGGSNIARVGAFGGAQTIAGVTGISIDGGSTGGGFVTTPSYSTRGNFAQLFSLGTQTIGVGTGGIALTGGGGTASDNFASLFQSSTAGGAQQSITVAGGGSIVVKGGSSSGVAAPGQSGSGSFAFIRADGGAGQSVSFTGAGSEIRITGGTLGTSNDAGLFAANGPQTIAGAPAITMTGGASGGVAGSGNGAEISAAVGNQTIAAGLVTMTGGAGGINNNAQIRTNGAGSLQKLTATGIVMTGGSGGGAEGPNSVSSAGNRVQIRGDANQEITVGAGGITIQGGSGGVDTFGQIRQGVVTTGNPATPGTHQTITVNGGGAIKLIGGTSPSVATAAGNGSHARIRGEGDTQTIAFTNGGSIELTGGGAGTTNEASILSNSGAQTITGNPNVTMTAGSSGGQTGDGNFAQIRSDVSQNFALGNLTLTGGSGGVDTFATIQSPTQNIAVTGNLALTGASGGSGAIGSRIGGNRDATTNLTLTVGGNVTLTGGAVAGGGAALGPSGNSASALAGRVTLTAGGDVTLNGGSVAGSRIGHVGGLVGPGDIAVSAGGNILLAGGASNAVIRTTGNVSLQANAPGKTITTDANGLVVANTLDASASGGISFGGVNQVARANLSTGGDVTFSNAGPLTFDGGAAASAIDTPAGAQTVTVKTTGAASDITLTGDLSNSDDNFVFVSGRDIIVAGGSNIAAGSATLSGAGAARFASGSVTVNSPITANLPVALTGANVTFNGATQLNGGVTFSAGTVQGTGAVNVNAGTLAWSGGTLAGTGAFTTALNVSTNVTGPVTVSGRTWNNAGAVASGGAGEVFLQNNAVVNNQPSATWTVGSGVGTVMRGDGGSGTFNNAGVLKHVGGGSEFFGPDVLTNTGAIRVEEGTLAVSGLATNAGTLFVAPGATFVSPSFANGPAGTIAGNGTIRLNDPLTQTGMLTNSGTVAPGSSPGMLTVDGNYTQTPSGVLNIEVAGATPGTGYDVLNVTGTAALAGTVNLVPVNGYSPPAGESYAFMNYGSSSGAFTAPQGFTASPGPTQYTISREVINAAQAQIVAIPSNDTRTLNDQSTQTTAAIQQESVQQQEEKAQQKAEKKEVARECR